MEKLILILLVASGISFGQGLLLGDGATSVYAVDLDGSTEYLSKTSPVNLDLNGANRITNQIDKDYELTEILSPFDFTDGDWIEVNTTITGVASFTVDVANGYLYHGTSNYITSGKKYKLDVSGSTTGTKLQFMSADGSQIYIAGLGGAFDTSVVFDASVSTTMAISDSGTSSTSVIKLRLTQVSFWAGTGNHSFDTTSTNNGGSYGGMIVAADMGDPVTNYVSLAAKFTTLEDGKKYTMQFDAKGSGVDSPSLTAQIGDSSKTFTSLSPSTWQTLVWNFEYSATDLLSGWDFTSGWTTAGTTTIDDINTFTSVGIGGVYKNSNILFSGKRYKITIKGTSTSTSVTLFDANPTPRNTIATDVLNGTTNIYYYTMTRDGNLYLRNGDSGTSDVTTMEVVETPDLQLYANQPDTVYIDNVDLSEAYDMTLMVWAASGVDQNTGVLVLGSYYSAIEDYLAIDTRTNPIVRFAASDNNRLTNFSTLGTFPSDSTWHHMSITIDRENNTYVYLDGVLSATIDITEWGALRFASPLKVGLTYNSASSFGGQIGEIQIIRGQVLTASEILSAYNRGLKGKHFLSNSNVVGWWKFKGKTDATFLRDETGNNDLTGNNVSQSDDQVKLKKYAD